MQKSKLFLYSSAIAFCAVLIGAAVVFPVEKDDSANHTDLDFSDVELDHPIDVYSLERSEEDMNYILSLTEEEKTSLAQQVYQGLLTGDAAGHDANGLMLFEFAIKIDGAFGFEITNEQRSALIEAYRVAQEERDVVEVPEESTAEELEVIHADMVNRFKDAVHEILANEELESRFYEI
jgi:hypothetical protein